jgi:hypothetical protein
MTKLQKTVVENATAKGSVLVSGTRFRVETAQARPAASCSRLIARILPQPRWNTVQPPTRSMRGRVRTGSASSECSGEEDESFCAAFVSKPARKVRRPFFSLRRHGGKRGNARRRRSTGCELIWKVLSLCTSPSLSLSPLATTPECRTRA